MCAAFHSFCYFNKLFQLLRFCGMGRYAVVAMSLLGQVQRSKKCPRMQISAAPGKILYSLFAVRDFQFAEGRQRIIASDVCSV
jgi:hypothetical protein